MRPGFISPTVWRRYQPIVMGGVAIFGVVTALFMGYRWYIHYRDSSATAAFFSVLQQERAGGDASLLARKFTEVAQEYRSSPISLYSEVASIDALIRVGSYDAARQQLAALVERMEEGQPYTALLSIKYALLQLDSDQPADRDDGLARLIAEAYNEVSEYRDCALFYLGRYHWVKGSIADAQKAWRDLIEVSQGQAEAKSPWVSMVQPLLEQRIV